MEPADVHSIKVISPRQDSPSRVHQEFLFLMGVVKFMSETTIPTIVSDIQRVLTQVNLFSLK